MSLMASEITSLTIVSSNIYLGADQRKKSKLRVNDLCEGNSPENGEFPAQKASYAENVPIWWRHHPTSLFLFRLRYKSYDYLAQQWAKT